MTGEPSPTTIRPPRPEPGAVVWVLLASFALAVFFLAVPVAGIAAAGPVGAGPSPPAASVALPGVDRPAPGHGYGWPLRPVPAVHTPFRAPEQPYGPGHRGVDLVGTAGQAVLAARGGIVVFAGPVAGREVVSVDHDDGLRTTYEPVRPVVRAGTVITAGDVLGLLGAGHPGCPGSVCLHWGVRRDRSEYLDPLALVRTVRLRLLPVPTPWPLSAPQP